MREDSPAVEKVSPSFVELTLRVGEGHRVIAS